MYFGWFDGNPANLNPLPPSQLGAKYVEAMGGSSKVLKIARRSYKNGEYRWCATLLNNLVFAEPDNIDARELLSDTYKHLGYSAESGPWRNFYLTGAQEVLKDRPASVIQLVNERSIAALENDMLMDYFGIQINGSLSSGKAATVNIRMTDTGEVMAIMLSNGALSHRIGTLDRNADLSIELKKIDFVRLMLGTETMDKLLTSGRIKTKGDIKTMEIIISSMDKANPDFNIVLP